MIGKNLKIEFFFLTLFYGMCILTAVAHHYYTIFWR